MRLVLTQNAKFKPYSFERLLQPLAMYTQEYNTVQEGISELSTKAELIKQYAQEAPDSKTAKMYNDYSESLKRQAEDLTKNGLAAVNRTNLLNLRTQYQSSIAPIETAVIRRRQLADEQRKGASSNPTIMYNRDFSDADLDALIENPELSYSSYSGALLTKQVSDAVEGIKSSLSEYGKGKPIDAYTNTFIQNYGFRPEEVLEAINNPNSSSAPKVLTAIVDSVIGASPINTWENREDVLPQAYGYARQGLWNAVGKSSVNPMENYYARLNAQAQKEKDVYDYKKRQDTLDTTDPNNPQRHYRSIATTTVDDTKKTAQMKSDADFLREVAANPNLLNQTAQRYIGGAGTRITGATTGGHFEEYKPYLDRYENIVNRYGDLFSQMSQSGNISYESLANYIEDDIRKSALRQNSYIMDVTNPELMAKTIRENSVTLSSKSGNSGMWELTKDGKKRRQSDIEEVLEYINDSSHLEYDPSKGIVIHGIKDGTVKSFVLDPETVTGESIDTGGIKRNKYQSIINLINEGIDSGNEYIVNEGIDRLMNELYYQFNSISKVQGKTLSAKEEQGS